VSEQPEAADGTTRIHVFGQALTIKGGVDEAYIQSLATFVTSHMERLAKESPLTPLPQVAMLAAMNISHELFELRNRTNMQQAALDTRTEGLLAQIEAEFHPSPLDA
jgi:cell division protein ZapA (FtsZ GTPase activity inhibitor)